MPAPEPTHSLPPDGAAPHPPDHPTPGPDATPAEPSPPGGADPVELIVNAVALRFEAAWDAEYPPAVADFLPSEGPARAAAALELALIDRERRQAAGLVGNRAVAVAGTGSGPPGYELLEEVGRGGMGLVYRTRDTRLNRPVAVKVLQDKYAPRSVHARRFVGEARITAQLQHPGVPPVHEVGELPDGRPFLAMKLIQGRTLAEILDAGPADRGPLVAAFEGGVPGGRLRPRPRRDPP
jgi:hypothetical protein